MDSLAPWADHLPSDWSLCRLDALADVLFSNVDKHTIEGEIPVRLCNYVDVYKNERITAAIEFMEASAEAREIAKFQIRRGDVLATKDSEEPDDIAISALVTEELPGVVCGYHLGLIRPRSRRIFSDFIAWVHRSKQFLAQYEARAVGVTRFGLSQYAFRSVLVPLPPLPEQQRIAAYLDESCAAIDAAVVAKRQQLETLDRVRESAVETAVTRGIRPGVPLRRVSEEWIGELPTHWGACRIKRVVSQVDYGISEKTGQDGRFPVLKMGNIQRGEIVFSDMEFVENVVDELLLETDDILYNRTNSPDQVGKAALFRGNRKDGITFASYLVRLRLNHRARPRFFNYLVNSPGFLSFARKLAIPSVQQSNLNSTRYCRMLIPVPPTDEQEAIADYLDAKLADMGRVVSIINRQIEALTAYRKSLIHECVTGQKRIELADSKPMAAYG